MTAAEEPPSEPSSDLLQDLVATWVVLGDLDRAWSILGTATDLDQRVSGLLTLVRAAAGTAGDVGAAVRELEGIAARRSGDERLALLVRTATAAAPRDRRPDPLSALREAAASPSPGSGAGSPALARALILLGDLRGAERVGVEIPAPCVREGVFTEIAAAYGSAGDVTGARRTFLAAVGAGCSDGGEGVAPARMVRWLTVARALLDADDPTGARWIAAAAERELRARQGGRPDLFAAGRAQVATVLAEAGYRADGRRLVSIVEEDLAAHRRDRPDLVADGLARAAAVLAAAGDRRAARRLVAAAEREIGWSREPEFQMFSLAEVIRAETVLGDRVRVRQVGERAAAVWNVSRTAEESLARALGDVATALGEGGVYEAAAELAWAVPEDYYRGWALADLVRALARAGHFAQAELTAWLAARHLGAEADPLHGRRALCELARCLAVAGQPARAREVARRAERAPQNALSPDLVR